MDAPRMAFDGIAFQLGSLVVRKIDPAQEVGQVTGIVYRDMGYAYLVSFCREDGEIESQAFAIELRAATAEEVAEIGSGDCEAENA